MVRCFQSQKIHFPIEYTLIYSDVARNDKSTPVACKRIRECGGYFPHFLHMLVLKGHDGALHDGINDRATACFELGV